MAVTNQRGNQKVYQKLGDEPRKKSVGKKYFEVPFISERFEL